MWVGDLQFAVVEASATQWFPVFVFLRLSYILSFQYMRYHLVNVLLHRKFLPSTSFWKTLDVMYDFSGVISYFLAVTALLVAGYYSTLHQIQRTGHTKAQRIVVYSEQDILIFEFQINIFNFFDFSLVSVYCIIIRWMPSPNCLPKCRSSGFSSNKQLRT